jgi:hypothetical protein
MHTTEQAISPLSGAHSKYLFSATVLGRHKADYFFDPETKYIFVKDPHWLAEAYCDAISTTDTGILGRNLHNIETVERLLNGLRLNPQSCVDLGGGYGIFVRGMRDRGFNFFWSDKFSKNLLARGFEAQPGVFQFAVAFEVLEHTLNPLEFLKQERSKFVFDALCFSANCFDPNNIPSMDWWYWAFESGQHISFFSRDTLEWLAEKLGLKLSWVEGDLFIMASEARLEILQFMRKSLLERVLNRATRLARRGQEVNRRSLAFDDHLTMVESLKREFAKTVVKANSSEGNIKHPEVKATFSKIHRAARDER